MTLTVETYHRKRDSPAKSSLVKSRRCQTCQNDLGGSPRHRTLLHSQPRYIRPNETRRKNFLLGIPLGILTRGFRSSMSYPRSQPSANVQLREGRAIEEVQSIADSAFAPSSAKTVIRPNGSRHKNFCLEWFGWHFSTALTAASHPHAPLLERSDFSLVVARR
jgi:hypothetical protein